MEYLMTHLWVDTSLGLFTTSHQTSVLHRIFLKNKVAPLGVNPWRHLCVAVCDQWLKEHPRIGLVDEEDDDDDDNGPNHVLDIQRNHTSQTANWVYGGTSGHSMDRRAEGQFRQACVLWQDFWGVSVYSFWLSNPNPNKTLIYFD
jgi:hypothetical protein